MSFNYNDIDDIIKRTKKAIGKTFNDFIHEDDRLNIKSKGQLGLIMEEGLYGLDISNKQAPDFEDLGVELKVTGYRWVNDGSKVSAKERLVITMIDFFNDINKDFYGTHLYEKIKKILLILYEYDKEKSYRDFIITHQYLYNFQEISEKDKIIIINDFEKIINKIRNGLAHELSEGDTMYLGAAPKGANSKSLRSQPFSNVPAMSRAYSLKTTYMTYLLRNHVFTDVESKESLIKDLNILKRHTIDEVIEQMFVPYKDKTLSDIDLMIGESLERKTNKQLLRSYTSRMLKVSESNLNHIEEFEKANIQIKTINLNDSGTLTESMSFPAMDFQEVAKETWETSDIRNLFETTKFLFVVFQKSNNYNKNSVFKGAFLWNMPLRDLDVHVQEVWTKTNQILNSSIELRIKADSRYKYVINNNFPNKTENPVSHVRPHGKNRRDTKYLPQSTKIEIIEKEVDAKLDYYFDEHKFTKMCFWLNNSYILSLINESDIEL